TPARADAKQVRAWLDDLDAEAFDRREDAERRLREMRSAVEADLRRLFTSGPSVGGAARLARLLEAVGEEAGGRPPARAVEALERMGTEEARRLLRELAGGYAGARLTREAKEALVRLGRKE